MSKEPDSPAGGTPGQVEGSNMHGCKDNEDASTRNVARSEIGVGGTNGSESSPSNKSSNQRASLVYQPRKSVTDARRST